MPASLSRAYGVSCRARAERVRYGCYRFAHGAEAPVGSPARLDLTPMRFGRCISPGTVPDFENGKAEAEKLGGLGELAAALELLADLANVSGGAVGALGDDAIGLLGAAAQLELEQSLTPGGPAVALRADRRLLDGLLALAVQAEPLAASPGPALGPAGDGVAACGIAHGHLAAGTGPTAGAGRSGALVCGCGLGHELPPRSRALLREGCL